ncbi:MAG: hypothetical protein ACLRWQ_06810 [Flavonifractor plautii]
MDGLTKYTAVLNIRLPRHRSGLPGGVLPRPAPGRLPTRGCFRTPWPPRHFGASSGAVLRRRPGHPPGGLGTARPSPAPPSSSPCLTVALVYLLASPCPGQSGCSIWSWPASW